MDALERFRLEFKGWVLAYNRIKGFEASPDEVLARLEQRIPKTMLRQIGAAFINGGWSMKQIAIGAILSRNLIDLGLEVGNGPLSLAQENASTHAGSYMSSLQIMED